MPSPRTLKRRKQRQASVQRLVRRMGPHQDEMRYLMCEAFEGVLASMQTNMAAESEIIRNILNGSQWPSELIGGRINIHRPTLMINRLPRD